MSRPLLTILYGKHFYFLILDQPSSPTVKILFGREIIKVQKADEIFKFRRDTILSISCQVTRDEDFGNPKGMLHWFNGSSDAAVKNVTGNGILANLSFLGLKKKDNGSYICRIENKVGRQEESIQLVVLGEVSYL